MATGDICPVSEDHVDVTVRPIFNGEIECAFVNSVYNRIIRLENGVQLP